MEALSSIFNSFVLILPVIAVVAGGFAVFVFGFKSPAEPKKFYQKSSDSGTRKQQKKNQAKPKANTNIPAAKSQQNSSVKQQTTTTTTTTTSTSNQQKKNNPKSATSAKNEVAVKKVTPTAAAPAKPAVNANKKSTETVKKSKPTAVANTTNKKSKSVPSITKSSDKKPVDFDDGNWFTVPTKLEKKKPKTDDGGVNSGITKSEKKSNDKSATGTGATIGGGASGNTGNLSSPKLNQKTLKDQANKVKKEAEAAAVEIKTPAPKVVKEPAPVHHISIDEIPKIQSKIGFEFIINRKTIIENAINDKKELNSDLSSVEKIDNIKVVDDAWKVLKD